MHASPPPTTAVRRRWPFRVMVAVGLLTIAGLSVYTVLDGVFWQITRPGRYVLIADQYRGIAADRPAGTPLIAVFPSGLPAIGRAVRFSYWTPPGDVSLQLRCTLPPADVAALVARWSPAALATTRGGEEPSGRYFGPVDDNQYFVLDPPGGRRLPESYVVYTTAVGHTMLDAGTQWDYQAGLAVNGPASDVIYWMWGHATGAHPVAPPPPPPRGGPFAPGYQRQPAAAATR